MRTPAPPPSQDCSWGVRPRSARETAQQPSSARFGVSVWRSGVVAVVPLSAELLSRLGGIMLAVRYSGEVYLLLFSVYMFFCFVSSTICDS